MGIRTMKLDLFTIKALQSKGYELEQLLALTDAEVDALPISTTLIDGVKALRARGGQTADVIAEQIADLMMRDDVPVIEEIAVDYKDLASFEVQPEEVVEVVEEEEFAVADEDDEEFATEDVIRVESKAEDIDVIKEALQGKEAKSFQPFIKHLKTAVPEAILDAVDSTVVSDLIEARIAEVKAQQEKTK